MTYLRVALDNVVVASVIGVVFIALAFAEGLHVPRPALSEPVALAEPMVLASAPVAVAR
jgi:hypothetical protein